MKVSAPDHALELHTPTEQTFDPHGRRRRVAGITGLLVLVAAMFAAWATEQPPAPLPASAPPSVFSADRALRHLERITGDQPTPIGSAGGDVIREYLVSQLRALDLDVEVQTGIGAHAYSEIIAGRAENVVATLPGQDPTGRVVLAAHYDTPTTSPGASDDKMSVAAILEIARALTREEQPRNDLVFLLSDGEEPGLIGAEAFARQHPYGAEGGVMINLEGPGNAGPSALYNTSSNNAALVREFADQVPHPVGESAVTEFYRTGPFSSDFTVLRESNFIGLEFGPIGGRAFYHHPRDTVDRLSPASLQHQGENGLALARALADRDLDELRSSGDASFFTVFGQVVHYSSAFVWPLAALGLGAVVALCSVVRARRLTSAPRLLAGAALAAVPIVAAPLAAFGLWKLLLIARPGYGGLMSFEPYRPTFYRWALATVTVAIVVGWYLALRRRIGPTALTAGALVWPAVFGVAMAALVPGMSYYGALTALCATIGGAVGILVYERRPVWHAVAVTAGALPGAVLWSIGGRALLSALGVGNAFPAVLFFVMGALTMLPLLAIALPDGRWTTLAVPAALVTVMVVLTGAGLVVDQFDEDHPEMAYLMYVHDADTGTASWGSVDADPHPWAASYVPDVSTDDRLTAALPFGITLNRTGPARTTSLATPQVQVLDSRTEADTTVLRLRATSHRDAYAISVHVDRQVREATLSVAGHPTIDLPALPPGSGRSSDWPWEVQFYDPPADGVELTLRVAGTEQPRIGIADWTNGLDGLPGFDPRPPNVVMSPAGPPTDSVVVTHVHQQ